MEFLMCIGLAMGLVGGIVLLGGEFIEHCKRPLNKSSKYTVKADYNSIEEAREILFDTYTEIVRKNG